MRYLKYLDRVSKSPFCGGMQGARESTGDETRHLKLDSLTGHNVVVFIDFFTYSHDRDCLPRCSAGSESMANVIHEITVHTTYIPKFSPTVSRNVLNTIVLTPVERRYFP
jgi:hypothetical protein